MKDVFNQLSERDKFDLIFKYLSQNTNFCVFLLDEFRDLVTSGLKVGDIIQYNDEVYAILEITRDSFIVIWVEGKRSLIQNLTFDQIDKIHKHRTEDDDDSKRHIPIKSYPKIENSHITSGLENVSCTPFWRPPKKLPPT